MLNAGANETCPITEVSSWSDYFNALYNGETNAFNDVSAEAILSFINGMTRGEGRGWENSTGDRVERVAAATALNTPFTLEEVTKAIRALGNNKSVGFEKVPAECYKYAKREVDGRYVNVLAPHILTLLEHIRSTGDYPEQFEVSCLTPIHKKGDTLDKRNYRGLAVGVHWQNVARTCLYVA